MDLLEAFTFLGVTDQTPYEKCQQRYRQLTHLYHPDRGGEVGKMASLNAAWAMVEEHYSSWSQGILGGQSLAAWAEKVFVGNYYIVVVHTPQLQIPPRSMVYVNEQLVYYKPFGPRQLLFRISPKSSEDILDVLSRYGVKPSKVCDLQFGDPRVGAWVSWEADGGWRSISFRKRKR